MEIRVNRSFDFSASFYVLETFEFERLTLVNNLGRQHNNLMLIAPSASEWSFQARSIVGSILEYIDATVCH